MSKFKTVIAIVGMGPRGLSVLERLITYIIKNKLNNNIKITIFDYRKDFGSGCHDSLIPESFLVNTVASQMTMYFDDSVSEYGEVYKGDTLYEWCMKNNYTNINKTSYLPRIVLGKYLNDFYKKQKDRMECNNIDYNEEVKEVIDIDPNDNTIFTTESSYKFNKVVVCTGHDIRNKNNSYNELEHKGYINAYDYTTISSIPKEKNIAIKGMGLTAFDVLTYLTSDRGGVFVKVSDNKLKYIPSGNEPNIFIYSRSGVFYSGRAFNPSPEYIYSAKYFTLEAIKKIKLTKKYLDFDRDFLPLLYEEIKYIYREVFNEECIDIDLFLHPEKNLQTQSFDVFHESFMEYLRWDINQSSIGKMDSAYKFCQDMIRDVRDQFREIINFHNLTESSFADFQEKWHRQFLKICVGPPYLRLMQLEALIEAGVCHTNLAFNPKINWNDSSFEFISHYKEDKCRREIKYIIDGMSNSSIISKSNSKLPKNLIKKFKKFTVLDKNLGGLETNKDFNLCSYENNIYKDVYAFGIPTEGTKYFTQVLGRPNMKSTFLLESNELVKILLNSLNSYQNKNNESFIKKYA